MTKLTLLLTAVLILPLAALASDIQMDAAQAQPIEPENEAIIGAPAGPTQYTCIVFMGRLICF